MATLRYNTPLSQLAVTLCDRFLEKQKNHPNMIPHDIYKFMEYCNELLNLNNQPGDSDRVLIMLDLYGKKSATKQSLCCQIEAILSI